MSHTKLSSQASRHILVSSPPALSLTFLAPSVCLQQRSSISTSSPACFPRDYNRQRGVSSIRRTGPRQPLSVSKVPLPIPVTDPSRHSAVKVDKDHGLWDFFHSRNKPMNTPEEDDAHGRPWSAEELRGKSWEDLHSLWWVCVKERNRIATEAAENVRLKAGYGEAESKGRDKAVRQTQRAIKHTLTERYYAWEEARRLAATDEEVDLSGHGQAYKPKNLEETDDEMVPPTSPVACGTADGSPPSVEAKDLR